MIESAVAEDGCYSFGDWVSEEEKQKAGVEPNPIQTRTVDNGSASGVVSTPAAAVKTDIAKQACMCPCEGYDFEGDFSGEPFWEQIAEDKPNIFILVDMDEKNNPIGKMFHGNNPKVFDSYATSMKNPKIISAKDKKFIKKADAKAYVSDDGSIKSPEEMGIDSSNENKPKKIVDIDGKEYSSADVMPE